MKELVKASQNVIELFDKIACDFVLKPEEFAVVNNLRFVLEKFDAIEPHYRLLRDTTVEERSWNDEQQYYNCCINCGRQFTGNKRRFICKTCS